jgi:trans-aconitate methyltransferase
VSAPDTSAVQDGTTQVDDWDSHWGSYASTAEDNPAQRYRRELTFRLLAAHGTPERLVDIGSGQGDLLAELAKAFPSAELVGLELSATGVEEGRSKVPDATFIQQDLLARGVVDEGLRHWASHAVCSEVLEHVDEPVRLLSNARGYLAPGCVLVVTVPGGPRSAFDVHIGHRRHYDREALRQLLQSAGLEVEAVHAAGFPAFNVYKLLVVARGKRLIDDVRTGAGGASSRLARVVMAAFGPLFRFARLDSRWGWQLVAVARVPRHDVDG